MAKKIVFMGTSFFAGPILKSLYQNGYPISAVYTQPPKKSKRGMSVNPTPIQSLSETFNLEVRTPSSLKNNKEEYEYLKKLNPDIAIVVSYGQIIPKEILSLTKKNFINIHASLLPKWRGAAPIQRSIMNLDKQTGISIMKLEEKLDTGPICNSYSLNILENENSESLSERLSLLAAEKIGVNPKHCWVVEDSQSGVKAALDAGCQVWMLNKEKYIFTSEEQKLESNLIQIDEINTFL